MAPTKTHLRHTSPKNHLPKKTKNRKKSLRDQLRSVQRLLRQENLPANMRVAQERILNMLEKELRDKAKEDRDKKIAKKYKMVKFFELRKVQRKYNNCKKNLDTCTEDHERKSLEEELKQIQQQWNYVTYFPTEMKYISLFPPTPCNSEEAIKKKDKIFKMINEKVESGEFREAYDMMASPGKDKVQGKKKSPGKLLNLNMSGDDNDQETAKQVLEDDFFIDTKPNVLKDKEELLRKP
ncbi:rRNA-processing protein efg1 isoform X2 [Nematostella vectensis]|uniref:rRNA-processing protein efg1 isoform X2 n=1 Tax=Nematostella vectensis TaxID=45351 RepID=UPI002076F021|nr:rRNA-processing protein efg1 isoform X2 [Nematostella vectensis]